MATNAPALLIDPGHDVAAVEEPTEEEVAALTDAEHGVNPELIDGDER